MLRAMYMSVLFNYYMIGRFVFAVALLFSMQVAGFFSFLPTLLGILLIYAAVVLIRVFTSAQRINYFDFLFDIVFLTAVVYLTVATSSFLTLLYLFPIFFSSLVISSKRIFLFPATGIVLYASAFYTSQPWLSTDYILNVLLHAVSFFLIAVAGNAVKERIERQNAYIKRLEEERIRMRGYERLYRVSADLAHELRNPLASISANVQFLREGQTDPELLDMITSDTQRLTNLVSSFLVYARPSEAPAEQVFLDEVVKVLVAHEATGKHVVIENAEHAAIMANRTFVEVAVSNVLKNAVEAAQSSVVVSVKEVLAESVLGRQSQSSLVITVEDDGEGIAPDLQDKIFEPFVTTKPNGTGLGLAIAYRILSSLGGMILFEKSQLLGGAKFSIVFPTGERGAA